MVLPDDDASGERTESIGSTRASVPRDGGAASEGGPGARDTR